MNDEEREELGKPPYPSPLCFACHERPYDADEPARHPRQVAILFLCPECRADYDETMGAWSELARRQSAGLVPPFTEEDVWTAWMMPAWMLKLTEVQHAVSAWKRNQRRTGKPPDLATIWLLQQGPARGRSALYWDWLAEDGSEDNAYARDRFRKLWKRYFGGK